jgi:toxin ParE1/3/4
MRYRLSELAEQDLLETWLHVAADASVERADRLLEAIGQRFELLAEHPRMGRQRPEFGSDVRSFVVENHVIYYRPEKELLIARVLHGSRDQIAAWQESAEDDERER